MQESKPTYEALAKENVILRTKIAQLEEAFSLQNIELTEVKAQMAEFRHLMYDTKSESRGSNRTPAKKKRKKK